MTLPKTILVPTDFSDTAHGAGEQACELAERLGAKVHFFHAYLVPPFPDALAVGVDVLAPVEASAELAMAHEIARYETRPSFGGSRCAMGESGEMIVAEARRLGADLIVIGSHGRRGFKRLMLGSVAEAVVRAARCSVLVVHGQDAATSR
jgi:nucleotide-binding universal stress UspA family protein